MTNGSLLVYAWTDWRTSTLKSRNDSWTVDDDNVGHGMSRFLTVSRFCMLKSWPFPYTKEPALHSWIPPSPSPSNSIKCRRDSHATSKASAVTTSSISQITSHFIGSSHIAVRTINNSSGERRDQKTVISSPATSKTLSVLPKHTKKSFAESLPLKLQ